MYAAMKYDYGRRERGHSFEHNNFFDTLRRMGHDILYFDFGTLSTLLGRAAMNARLEDIVRTEQPELLFTVLYRDELDRQTVRRISESGRTTTFNWFCDDHWRFDTFSREWAPAFNWVATTAESAVPKYKLSGYDHAIKTQWASNPFMYRSLGLPLSYDVTFVGLPHGDRRYVIERVRDAGVDLRAWGSGWPAGRLTQDEMIEVFNRSRINLNLSNSSQPRTLRDRLAGFAVRRLVRLPVEGGQRKALLRMLSYLEPQAVPGSDQRYLEQIKGRNFEVPGCGGFLLTGEAENLADYYVPDREIATFSTLDALIARIHYFLTHEDHRREIAEAGYRRTARDHTYVHRFTQIFRRMGLPESNTDRILGCQIAPGSVVEVN